jgi:hypothetical protein
MLIEIVHDLVYVADHIAHEQLIMCSIMGMSTHATHTQPSVDTHNVQRVGTHGHQHAHALPCVTGYRSVGCGSTTCVGGTVAAHAFQAADDAAIHVVVAEVPALSVVDGLAATPARQHTLTLE